MAMAPRKQKLNTAITTTTAVALAVATCCSHGCPAVMAIIKPYELNNKYTYGMINLSTFTSSFPWALALADLLPDRATNLRQEKRHKRSNCPIVQLSVRPEANPCFMIGFKGR